ncbi:hypothetical protein JCM19992_14720 [Thermostilla marina]
MNVRTWKGILQLVRLPNLFTAAADSVAGLLTGTALSTMPAVWTQQQLVAHVPTAVVVGATSAFVYAFGVVVNDIVDRNLDAAERPERPIPSGTITIAAARRLAVGLLVGAVLSMLLAMWIVRPSSDASAIAGSAAFAGLVVCVIAYNAKLKPTAAGPIAMGACRGLNFAWAYLAASGPLDHGLGIVCGLTCYVAGLTLFARTEAVHSSRATTAMAGCIMLAGIAILGFFGAQFPIAAKDTFRWTSLFVLLAGWLAFRCVWVLQNPTSKRVQLVVTQAIFGLIVLDAAVVFAAAGLTAALCALVLLPPTIFAGRYLRAT